MYQRLFCTDSNRFEHYFAKHPETHSVFKPSVWFPMPFFSDSSQNNNQIVLHIYQDSLKDTLQPDMETLET